MPTTKENALLEQGGNLKTKNYQPRNNNKRFPPYGRQLDDLRRKGLVPVQRVIVSTDWKLGAAFPRIVIPVDTKPENLQFRYLAGLSVQIVHHTGQAELVNNLIEEILRVKPGILALFNFDLARNKNREHSALTLIHPARGIFNNGL